MKSSFEKLVNKPADWLVMGDFEDDMVLSSRVRMARNIEGKSFTHCSSARALAELKEKIESAVLDTEMLKDSLTINMDELSEAERMILAERRIISQEMVKVYKNRGLVVSEDERLGVMINEEDHLRLHAVGPGLSVQDAFSRVNSLDDELDKRLDYAFSSRLGYLTACATNVGTGLRVSSLVHLPGLVHNNDIRQVVDGMRHVRLSVRGTYGEGSEVVGNFFQISNSITLGLSEYDTVKNMETHINKVVEFEKKARDKLLKEARTLLKDKVCRSYGILKNARMISSKEAMGLMSAARMGVGLGMLSGIRINALNELLIKIQPMHLQRLSGKVLAPEERDVARADLIRGVFESDN